MKANYKILLLGFLSLLFTSFLLFESYESFFKKAYQLEYYDYVKENSESCD